MRACVCVCVRARVCVSLSALPGVSAIAVALGSYHTCVIASGGGVKCWGYNGNGQLGIDSTDICSGDPCATQPADVTGDRTPPSPPFRLIYL